MNWYFSLGLELDGISKYANLTDILPEYSEISVYFDPKVEPFQPKEFSSDNEEYLYINVSDLKYRCMYYHVIRCHIYYMLVLAITILCVIYRTTQYYIFEYVKLNTLDTILH